MLPYLPLRPFKLFYFFFIFFFKLSNCLQTIKFYLVKIRILQTARAHLISAREHSAINNLIEAEKEYGGKLSSNSLNFFRQRLMKYGLELTKVTYPRYSAVLAMLKPSICLRKH